MKSILEEIYYGNRGSSENLEFGEAYHKALSEGCEIYEKLEKSLNKRQKKLLVKLFWSDSEQEAEAVKAVYIEGFKIGFRIAVECLTE